MVCPGFKSLELIMYMLLLLKEAVQRVWLPDWMRSGKDMNAVFPAVAEQQVLLPWSIVFFSWAGARSKEKTEIGPGHFDWGRITGTRETGLSCISCKRSRCRKTAKNRRLAPACGLCEHPKKVRLFGCVFLSASFLQFQLYRKKERSSLTPCKAQGRKSRPYLWNRLSVSSLL